jgi:hypothetical protein
MAQVLRIATGTCQEARPPPWVAGVGYGVNTDICRYGIVGNFGRRYTYVLEAGRTMPPQDPPYAADADAITLGKHTLHGA